MYQWIILSALVQYILDGPLHILKCHSLSFPENIMFLSLKIVFVLANSVDPDEFQNHNLKDKRIHVYLTTPFKREKVKTQFVITLILHGTTRKVKTMRKSTSNESQVSLFSYIATPLLTLFIPYTAKKVLWQTVQTWMKRKAAFYQGLHYFQWYNSHLIQK